MTPIIALLVLVPLALDAAALAVGMALRASREDTAARARRSLLLAAAEAVMLGLGLLVGSGLARRFAPFSRLGGVLLVALGLLELLEDVLPKRPKRNGLREAALVLSATWDELFAGLGAGGLPHATWQLAPALFVVTFLVTLGAQQLAPSLRGVREGAERVAGLWFVLLGGAMLLGLI